MLQVIFGIFSLGEPLQFPGKPRNSAEMDVVDLKKVDFLEGVAKKSMNRHSEHGLIFHQPQKLLNSQKTEKKHKTEDDPNKLCCFCQKTQNNRFMIGCDTCPGNSFYKGYCQLVGCGLICWLGSLDGHN